MKIVDEFQASSELKEIIEINQRIESDMSYFMKETKKREAKEKTFLQELKLIYPNIYK
jgi:hypothetical protein